MPNNKSKLNKPNAPKGSTLPRAPAIERTKLRAATPGKTGRNDYLASLADPRTGTAARIPDNCTFPSTTFQTTARFPLTTSADGYAGLCWAPALIDDLFYPAFNPAALASPDELSMVVNFTSGAGTVQVGNVTSSLLQTQIDAIIAQFSAIRPVSAVMTFTPTGPALTQQGFTLSNCNPREQFPYAIDDAQTSAVGAGSFMPGFNTGPSTQALLAQTNLTVAAINQPVEIIWKPQDPDCWNYRPTGEVETGPVQVGEKGPELGGWYVTYFRYDTVTATNNVAYALPWMADAPLAGGGTAILGNVGAAIGNPTVSASWSPPVPINEGAAYPYLLFHVQGAVASTTVGEMTILVNWEALPRTNTLNLVQVSPSLSNPDELTQATNVITAMPSVVIPGVSDDPGLAAKKAVLDGSTHLYDATVPRKAALEGTSIWTKLKSKLKNIDWAKLAKRGLTALFPRAGALLG